jgi:predicted nucleic-acid-binding protein
VIGIDTNVLIRYIVRDDPEQTRVATTFIDSLTFEERGFITLVSIAEIYWVLDHSFKASREVIYSTFQSLLTSREILIQNAFLVHAALQRYMQTNADFDDCLIAECSRAEGCDTIVTFDKRAAKAIGLTLLR